MDRGRSSRDTRIAPVLVAGCLSIATMIGAHAQPSQSTPSLPPSDAQQRSAKSAPAAQPPELAEANRQLRRGASGDALATVEGYLKLHPRDVNAQFLRAVALAELKRTDEAIAAFNALVASNPDLSEPHNNLAVLYASQGRLDRARAELEQAVVANPENAVALENLGDVYVRLAARAYEQSAQLDGSSRSARAKLALARELANNRGPKPASPNEPAVNAGEKRE